MVRIHRQSHMDRAIYLNNKYDSVKCLITMFYFEIILVFGIIIAAIIVSSIMSIVIAITVSIEVVSITVTISMITISITIAITISRAVCSRYFVFISSTSARSNALSYMINVQLTISVGTMSWEIATRKTIIIS